MRRNTSSIAARWTPLSTLIGSSAASMSSSRSRPAPRAPARPGSLRLAFHGPPSWRATRPASRVRSPQSVLTRPGSVVDHRQRPRVLRSAPPTTPKRSYPIVRTAFVSTYPPRHCGIAAFTSDLAANTDSREVVALHPPEQPASVYPIEVHHRIRTDELGRLPPHGGGPEQVRRRRLDPARVRDLGRRGRRFRP